MGGPEAGDPPGPSFPEGLLDQLALGGGVDPPEGALARLLLRPRHLDEVAVQRQVVADRVLGAETRAVTEGLPSGCPGTGFTVDVRLGVGFSPG